MIRQQGNNYELLIMYIEETIMDAYYWSDYSVSSTLYRNIMLNTHTNICIKKTANPQHLQKYIPICITNIYFGQVLGNLELYPPSGAEPEFWRCRGQDKKSIIIFLTICSKNTVQEAL